MPQSAHGAPLVFIGKDGCGNWVAQEHDGLFGGLFANRIDAVRYALFENGHHPERIIKLPTIIELDVNSRVVSQRLEKVRRRA